MSLLAGLSSAATAETLWVYGVNEQQGWYDADKTGNNDSNLCWAAVSSNLINWMQDQYEMPSYPYIPQDENVWIRYRNAVVANVFGDSRIGMEWWLTGDGLGYFEENTGGYYSLYEEDPYTIYLDNKYVRFVEGTAEQLTLYLRDVLTADTARQGIGINLNGHGITLWGVEFTDPLTISALWVTDSDDAIASVGDMDLFKVGVGYNNGSMYLTDYYSSANRVESLTVLDAKQIDEWGLERIYVDLSASLTVPEPATATLTLLAFAAISTRRRRD